MKHSNKIFAGVLLLLLVTACVPSDLLIVQESPAEEGTAVAAEPTSPPTAQTEPPTAMPEVPADTEMPSTATPMPTAVATVSPTDVPTKVPIPALTSANCLACHTDQQTLIAVAAPVEEPEDSLSSGVG